MENPYQSPGIRSSPGSRSASSALSISIFTGFVFGITVGCFAVYGYGYWNGYKDAERMLGGAIKREVESGKR